MNNESRHYFYRFLEKFGLEKCNTKRQVVIFPNGDKFSFSVSTNGKLECRQTYSDCKGFITYHCITNCYYMKRVDNIQEYPFTRMTRTGITAHNIREKLDSALLFDYVGSSN